MTRSPITILLAEDNPADQYLFRLALSEVQDLGLYMVDNGIDALRFLRKEGKYADAPRPDLVVLDVNLPGMRGPDVLAAIRLERSMKHLPVVIFTTERAVQTLVEVCKLNANFFAIKPDLPDEYFATVQAFQNYCRNIVQFPNLKTEFADEFRNLLQANGTLPLKTG